MSQLPFHYSSRPMVYRAPRVRSLAPMTEGEFLALVAISFCAGFAFALSLVLFI